MAFSRKDSDGDVAGGGRTLWCAQLGAHIAKLQSDLNRVRTRIHEGSADQEIAKKAQQHLDAAREILEKKFFKSPLIHIFGGLPYAALSNVHEAESEILQITPEDEAGKEFEKVLVQARLHLKPGDPRLVHLEEEARRRVDGRTGDLNHLDPWLKYLAADALHAANEAEDSEKSRLRDFVKMVRLYFIILTLVLGLVLISILPMSGAAGNNEDLRDIFCFTPSGGNQNDRFVCPTGNSAEFSDALMVGVFGLLGAALTGVMALRDMRNTAQPYNVSWWLLVLKFPVGAISAIAGIILIRADVIPGLSDLDSSAQILFWALVFGGLQETLTRAIDEQGRHIVDNTRSSERGVTSLGDPQEGSSDSARIGTTGSSTGERDKDRRGGGAGKRKNSHRVSGSLGKRT
jgi:hypothetical protein